MRKVLAGPDNILTQDQFSTVWVGGAGGHLKFAHNKIKIFPHYSFSQSDFYIFLPPPKKNPADAPVFNASLTLNLYVCVCLSLRIFYVL